MAGALDVLNVARSQIGFVEGKSEETPYSMWYGIPNASYCAMGVSWCFAQVGLSYLVAAQTPKGFSFCPTGLTWFQRQGCVVDKRSGMPGDLLFYDWNGDGVADHVEILEMASPDGITAIGFNTGNPNDPTNPTTGCYRVHRPYFYVMAIVRPKYPVTAQPTTSIGTSKKATAVVGTTGAAIAGSTAALHGMAGTPATITPTPTPSPTVFIAPPFPTSPNAFVIGAKGDAVLTIEKGLIKAGLLSKATGVMDATTVAALTKLEAKNPVLGAKNGTVTQLVYDTLKAKL